MIINSKDVHQQFASFFPNDRIRPYAYLLSKRMEEGHICIDEEEVQTHLSEMPYSRAIAASELKSITELVSTHASVVRPFMLHKKKLYLHRYFNYESQILNAIGALIEAGNKEQKLRKNLLLKQSQLLHSFAAKYDINGLPIEEKTDWQMVAIIQSVLHNFTIITGGPGTGKTTTVAKILSLLFTINPDCSVALAAPTGKAAMRMAESLKNAVLPVDKEVQNKLQSLSPNTIHRLLKFIPDSVNFKHHRDNPLPYDVVIVDEASMIDVALFAKLLDAIGNGTRIILLGDKNQLASVEAGSLFGDLCKAMSSNSIFSPDTATFINGLIPDLERGIYPKFIAKVTHPLAEHIVELQKSHRFQSSGGIGKFSKAIIHNDGIALTALSEKNEDIAVKIVDHHSHKEFENFIDSYKSYLGEKDISKALQLFNHLRVLCAVREGPQGVYAINLAIEQYLAKHHSLSPVGEFYENRPVIVTKNYPDLKLFNGDIGLLRKDENGNMRAWFEDSSKQLHGVMPGYLSHIETVFAMTVHKSQGSEYPEVLLVLPENYGEKILTRELLYTAVTRAKAQVTVITSTKQLLETAAATVKRSSGIIQRFDEIK